MLDYTDSIQLHIKSYCQLTLAHPRLGLSEQFPNNELRTNRIIKRNLRISPKMKGKRVSFKGHIFQ